MQQEKEGLCIYQVEGWASIWKKVQIKKARSVQSVVLDQNIAHDGNIYILIKSNQIKINLRILKLLFLFLIITKIINFIL
jgi:hypothetical protein